MGGGESIGRVKKWRMVAVGQNPWAGSINGEWQWSGGDPVGTWYALHGCLGSLVPCWFG
jgi:hypothetical protein